MAAEIQFRRESDLAGAPGKDREITIDEVTRRPAVHDGSTVGGAPIALLSDVAASGLPILTGDITLTVGGWVGSSQTVTVTGVTATSINTVIISDQTNGDLWGAANIYAPSQGVDSITFTCENVPTSDISFKVAIQEPA